MPSPALILHGGAGAPDPSEYAERDAALARSLDAGWARMGDGALEAVVAAVRALEDEPLLNAGIGASLNLDGEIEMDAGIMEGAGLRAGAVGAVKDVRHPIDLARAIMEDGHHVFLVGEGASRFARSHGVETCDPQVFMTDRQRADLERMLSPASHDTVGAVARDADGHLAVAVSTGGMTGKLPGRIGDSPIVGAGFYAKDGAGAACATGQGEGFIRLVLCHLAVRQLGSPRQLARGGAGMSPADVAEGAMRHLQEKTGMVGGIILLGAEGEPASAHSTPYMAVASHIE